MNKKTYFSGIVLIFILFWISLASANVRWVQEGNSAPFYSSGFGGGIYTSYYPTKFNNFSYAKCSISSGSYYEPVIDDINNDNVQDIGIISGNLMSYYDLNCNFITSITLPFSPTLMPTISNMNGNSFQEHIFAGATSMASYEYNYNTRQWNKIIDYTYPLNFTAPRSLSCGRFIVDSDSASNKKCLLHTVNTTVMPYKDQVVIFDFSSSYTAPSVIYNYFNWSIIFGLASATNNAVNPITYLRQDNSLDIMNTDELNSIISDYRI